MCVERCPALSPSPRLHYLSHRIKIRSMPVTDKYFSHCRFIFILVSSFLLQKDNPFLKSVNKVTIEFQSIIPDFIIGNSICCLFLSLKYHCRNPEYIRGRIRELLHSAFTPARNSPNFPFRLCYLLCLVDTNEINAASAMRELNVLGVKEQITLLLAWRLAFF